MRNLLLAADGAVHAALWATGPLLLPSLLYSTGDGRGGSRPSSAEEGSFLASSASVHVNGTDTAVARMAAKAGSGGNVPIFMASTTGAMAGVLVTFLLGRALGCYVMGRRRGVYPRLIFLLRRLPCTASLRDAPPHRVACLVVGLLVPLMLLNWGLGIYTLGGWMAIRFVTAFISGGIVTWGRDMNGVDGRNVKGKHYMNELQISMEEGQALLSGEDDDNKAGAASAAEKSLEKDWLDWHWIAGAAVSGLLGGLAFYPLNRFLSYFYPHERMYTFFLVVGLGGLVDRWLCRCYSVNRPAATASRFSNAGIAGGSNASFLSANDGVNTHAERSSSTQRRKQVHQSSKQSTFDEEQQIHNRHADSPHRHRLDSNDTVGSDQFFDCLDDIQLDTEHNNDARAAATLAPSYDSQVAVYSGRKIVYSDGTLASVPAGDSLSTIPPGYLALYKNDRNKAQTKYRLTQEWRREEQIESIHARPHTWFPKIKDAYPHVVHGFTRNGMPVVYESPGKMNLKELFRNGCRVEDMINHYCYFMEYLSNLEAINTELHSADNGIDADDDWQDELAAYSYAKQNRLQNDSVTFGFCVVMDISGATPTSLSGDVMVYLKRAGDINSLHYPGSMRQAIAVQAPFWIGVAWNAMKGVMPASVTVDLLSGAQTMEGGLKAYIDEDQIPVEYGGKSKYALGQHPFELGLRKLVERQGEAIGGLGLGRDEADMEMPPSRPNGTPLRRSASSAPLHFTPVPHLTEKAEMKLSSPASATELSAMSREWDGLSRDSILTVAALLSFFLHVVVGSLELALPYWMIDPPQRGGMGYEAHKNGATVFVSGLLTLSTMKCMRHSQLTQSTVEKSPLRGFRIGIGTACFALICTSLIPLTSDSYSVLGLASLSGCLSLTFLGIGWALVSLEYLRGSVVNSSEEGNGASISQQSPPWRSAIARVAGYIGVAPTHRWSIRNDLPFPLDGSFFLILSGCACWLLYVISFALHTAAPASVPTSEEKKKESQFLSAVSGVFSFVREVLLVAGTDIGILVRHEITLCFT
ncbi:hypothetical protein ACHAXT_002068 [Thalassiosira profunda]